MKMYNINAKSQMQIPTAIVTISLLLLTTIPCAIADNLKFKTSSFDGVTVLLTTENDNLDFAVEETASVACGYTTTNGKFNDFDIAWYDEKMELIKNNNRVVLSRINKTNLQSPKNGASQFLTMTISNLTKEDNQTYICSVTKGNNTQMRNMTINVHDKDTRYGFEGEDMSGWTTGETGSIPWHKHDASGASLLDYPTRPTSDHTYAPYKHIQFGHFVDAEVDHQAPPRNSKAVLISPSYGATTGPQCLHFWYVLDGDGIDKLTIFVKADNNTKSLADPLTIKSKIWKHITLTIPKQTKEYKIIFQANICNETCTKSGVSLDDIAITTDACENSEMTISKTTPVVKLQSPTKPTTKLTTTPTTTSTTSASTTTAPSTTVTPKSTDKPSTTKIPTTSPTSGTTVSTTTAHPSKGSTMSTTTNSTSTKQISSSTTLSTPTGSGKSTTKVTSSSTAQPSTTTVKHGNTSNPADNTPAQHGVSRATRIGRGVVAGIVIIVLLGVVIFAVLIYKGRKRRLRKSKYLNFGSASYSREHLPTNEFHLESPLTMSSMGYTVLA